MNCVTAGNLMVQLFMQTNPKYHLNNQKLQYLLCIAQMASINAGTQLFDEPIRNLKNNFTIEQIADNFTCTSAIQEGTNSDAKLNLTYRDFTLPCSIKRLYRVKEKIGEEQKRILIDVFVRFGAYNVTVLGYILNQLVGLRSYPVFSYITTDDLREFFAKAAKEPSRYEHNEVFAFCRNQRTDDSPQMADSRRQTTESIEQLGDKNEPVVETKPKVIPAVVAPIQMTDIRQQTTDNDERLVNNVVAKPEDLKEAQVVQEVKNIPTPRVAEVLTGRLSAGLQSMVAGKRYCFYIEELEDTPLKDVIVISLKDNKRIYGELEKLNGRLSRYCFEGVASDIKITTNF